MGLARPDRTAAMESTVTSKGQITLPKLIRQRLGIQTGSRIRFLVDERGHLQGEPLLYDLEDLWAAAVDALAFCHELPARAGVAGVPVSVFHDDPEAGRTLVRFAFCKRDEVLDEACRRLSS
mgnify:CR=1 FL=1